jgi:hypothetical protein
MAIGDQFSVHQEQKPNGAVKVYAHSEGRRLGPAYKFATRLEGDYTVVTRVDPDQQPSERRDVVAAAQLVGGDGGHYLGVLNPPESGAWVWPFSIMQPGDYFHVRHEDRLPEKVRGFALLRGRQLALPLRTTIDDPQHPGHIRIEYDAGRRAAPAPQAVNYGTMNAILTEHYGLSVEAIDPWAVQEKPDELRVPARQRSKPRNRMVMMDVDFALFGFELGEDEIVVNWLPKGTSYEMWLMGERASAPAAKQIEHVPHPLDATLEALTGRVDEKSQNEDN